MAALGIGTGVVAHAALACTVGASVFHSSLGLVLFCAASCWMLYLAWKIWPRGRKGSLAEKNHDPSYALFLGALIVVTGTAGWILWALVFRWQPIRSFYDRHAGGVDGVLSLVLAGFGLSMLYSFGRMAVESFS